MYQPIKEPGGSPHWNLRCHQFLMDTQVLCLWPLISTTCVARACVSACWLYETSGSFCAEQLLPPWELIVQHLLFLLSCFVVNNAFVFRWRNLRHERKMDQGWAGGCSVGPERVWPAEPRGVTCVQMNVCWRRRAVGSAAGAVHLVHHVVLDQLQHSS